MRENYFIDQIGPRRFAHNELASVSDPHEWMGNIVNQMGIGEQIYSTIMDVVSEHELWEQYVSSVYEWIKKKKAEVELICVNEQATV